MDPQQRILLELVWEAFEDAGENINDFANTRVGVFIGLSNSDYAKLLFKDARSISPFAGTGGALSIAANRISYTFNFRGPSLVIDTACSSSLAALHIASQSVLSGESEIAIVGGVNLLLAPESTVSLSQGGLLSPDGTCKVFDDSANGYVRSEGAGVVLMKKGSAATIANDRVRALILGSAINQDGHSNGLTAPNPESQRSLYKATLDRAGLQASQVSYIEAHGTGTVLGDAVEMSSLNAVYGGLSNSRHPPTCYVGSVKANVGHLEAASGLTGLMKCVLMLEHKVIPPQIHLETLSRKIQLNESRINVALSVTPWSVPEDPVAALSSFGFGGTNLHVLLTSGRQESTIRRDTPRMHMLAISNRSPQSLEVTLDAFVRALSVLDDESFGDFCFTSTTGRAHFSYRRMVIATGRVEALNQIQAMLDTGLGWHRTDTQDKQILSLPTLGFQERGVSVDPFLVSTCPWLAEEEDKLNKGLDHASLASGLERFISAVAVGRVLRRCSSAGIEYQGRGIGEYAARCLVDQDATATYTHAPSAFWQSMKSADDLNILKTNAWQDPDVISIPYHLNWESLLGILASLFERGVDIKWKEIGACDGRKIGGIPTVTFRKEKFWVKEARR